jgi:hypothetical protein
LSHTKTIGSDNSIGFEIRGSFWIQSIEDNHMTISSKVNGFLEDNHTPISTFRKQYGIRIITPPRSENSTLFPKLQIFSDHTVSLKDVFNFYIRQVN